MNPTPMIAIFPVFFILLLFAAAVVAGIALIVNRRTRVAGGVLLGLVAAVFFLGVAAVFVLRLSYHEPVTARQWRQAVPTARIEDRPLPIDEAGPATPTFVEPPSRRRAPENSTPLPAERDDSSMAGDSAKVTEQAGPPDEAAEPSGSSTAKDVRPGWLDRKGPSDPDTYQMVVAVGPYTSRLECEQHVPAVVHGAVDEFVAAYIGRQWAGRIRLSPDYLREQLIKAQWEEPVQASFGPMVQVHLLLEFDRKVKEHLKEQRNQLVVARRLGLLGTAVMAGLLVLAVAFVAMKIDVSTSGAYRRRLTAGAVAAVVAILLAAGIFFSALLETPRDARAPTEVRAAPEAVVLPDQPSQPLPSAPVMARRVDRGVTWVALLVIVGVVGLVVSGVTLAGRRARGGKAMLVIAALVAFFIAALIAFLLTAA